MIMHKKQCPLLANLELYNGEWKCYTFGIETQKRFRKYGVAYGDDN